MHAIIWTIKDLSYMLKTNRTYRRIKAYLSDTYTSFDWVQIRDKKEKRK